MATRLPTLCPYTKGAIVLTQLADDGRKHSGASFQILHQMIWDNLGPRIKQAEQLSDLVELRCIEGDLHQIIADLVRFGIYPVQWAALGTATATGQEKTFAESEREKQAEDIRFARVLDMDDVCYLSDRVYRALHEWITQQQIPESIWRLIRAYADLHLASNALSNRSELNDFEASQLAESYQDALLYLDALELEKTRPY